MVMMVVLRLLASCLTVSAQVVRQTMTVCTSQYVVVPSTGKYVFPSSCRFRRTAEYGGLPSSCDNCRHPADADVYLSRPILRGSRVYTYSETCLSLFLQNEWSFN